MLILGIETSCDETSAAIVEDGIGVRSNIVASQISIHSKYGGVVPEIACRAHLDSILPVISQALEEANCNWAEVAGIAVTTSPGLVGSLIVGVQAAKTLAWSRNLPLIPVNHVHAHAYSAVWAKEKWGLPAVALVASGGHTGIYLATEIDAPPRELGRTVDDAAGEAFDKVAKLLGLEYPGGPIIDRLARSGNKKAVKFPRAMMKKDSLDFSFSGLKTSVLYFLRDNETARTEDIAASFQEAVVDVLVGKVRIAALQEGVRHLFLCGGVASNTRLRERFLELENEGFICAISPAEFCTDNAAMIAGLGYHLLKKGITAPLTVEAKP